MSEKNKPELSEKDLDQVAGGMRKAGANAGNDKDNTTDTKSAAPGPVKPSTPPPSAG